MYWQSAVKLIIITLTVIKKKGISIHVRKDKMVAFPYLIKTEDTKKEELFLSAKKFTITFCYEIAITAELLQRYSIHKQLRNPGI